MTAAGPLTAPAAGRADRGEQTMEGVRRLPFELTLTTTAPESVRAGVLVVGAFADGALPPAAQRVDRAAHGGLSAVLKLGDLDPAAGATLLLPNLTGVAADRVLLVSLGAAEAWGDRAFREALEGAARALASGAARDAAVTLADVEVPGRSLRWRLQHASRLLADGAYRFVAPRTSSAGSGATKRGARRVALLTEGPIGADGERAVRRGHGVAEGMALARDLVYLPAGLGTPRLLTDTARALAREFGLEVEVLEHDDLKELGMGGLLATGSASGRAGLILLHYSAHGRTRRPIVLIGSGVSCDQIGAGPGRNDANQTFCASGAASVLGTIKVAARLRLPLNIIGIIPAVEGSAAGSGARPGDVVISMSGRTIEIRDEPDGRLAIADALTYAGRFNPACVIDVAALTGTCSAALGHVTSGLFANDDELADDLLVSGTESGDRAWRLPLWDEHEDPLSSLVADVSSAGRCQAAAIAAASFLGRFAGPYHWAHLDISGTNAITRGATGRPVPLLVEFLIRRATSAHASRRARAV